MVRHPAIQNLILQALYGSQNNSRIIPATHCSIFMGPAEYKRNISVSLIQSLWLWSMTFWKESIAYTSIVGAAICSHSRVEVHMRNVLKSFPHLRHLDSGFTLVHRYCFRCYMRLPWKWTEFTWFTMEMSWIVPCRAPAGLEALHIISGCIIPWLKWAMRALDPGSAP